MAPVVIVVEEGIVHDSIANAFYLSRVTSGITIRFHGIKVSCFDEL